MDDAITQEERARFLELQQMAFDLARRGEVPTLLSMLEAGLSPNLTNTQGNSLLMLAAYNGHYACTRMLIEHGADVNSTNDRGHSILAGVAFKGYLDLCKLLIEHGAKIENRLSHSPLLFASLFGRFEVVEYLSTQQKRRFSSKIFAFFARLFHHPKKAPLG